MKPLDPAGFFDALAARGRRTRIVLDRPMELDPRGGTEYGIEQVAELVRETTARLAAAGAMPGRHVAVVKRNHWDYTLIACAAARLGAVPALLSDRLTPQQLRVLLDRLDPTVVVTTADVLVEAMAEGIDLLTPGAATVTLDRPYPGGYHWFGPDALPKPQSLPRRRPRHDDDPLIVNHTSGTTGVPKLVIHSTTTLVRRLAAVESLPWPVLSSRKSDTVAAAFSFAHGRALPWILSVLWLAPRQVLIVSDDRPERAVPFLRTHPPTTLEALPCSYLRWQEAARAHDPAFGRVRLFLNTFDAVHPPTVRAFLAATRRRHPIWLQGWGQSETGPLTFRFFSRRGLDPNRRERVSTRDVGRALPGGAALRVVDPLTFEPLPNGKRGLLLTRTRARALGYVGEPERFAQKMQGPWFNTGDIGLRTRSGRIILLDREVDMLVGASCVEIEDVLHERLPGIEEAVVLPCASGPPVPVLITAADGGGIGAEQWKRAVLDLPRMAEPRLLPWDAVPRTGTGKVRRHELRESLLAGTAGHGTGRWT